MGLAGTHNAPSCLAHSYQEAHVIQCITTLQYTWGAPQLSTTLRLCPRDPIADYGRRPGGPHRGQISEGIPLWPSPQDNLPATLQAASPSESLWGCPWSTEMWCKPIFRQAKPKNHSSETAFSYCGKTLSETRENMNPIEKTHVYFKFAAPKPCLSESLKRKVRMPKLVSENL